VVTEAESGQLALGRTIDGVSSFILILPTEDDMTTEQKVARRKLSLLELASELDNVSTACQVLG